MADERKLTDDDLAEVAGAESVEMNQADVVMEPVQPVRDDDDIRPAPKKTGLPGERGR